MNSKKRSNLRNLLIDANLLLKIERDYQVQILSKVAIQDNLVFSKNHIIHQYTFLKYHYCHYCHCQYFYA